MRLDVFDAFDALYCVLNNPQRTSDAAGLGCIINAVLKLDTTLHESSDVTNNINITNNSTVYYILFFSFSFFNLTYSRWTSSLPPCLWSPRIFPSLPGSRLTIFYRDASSALLQLVNHWLNFTYSRSHAFRYERKITNPTLVRIELTTSALAGVQLPTRPLGLDYILHTVSHGNIPSSSRCLSTSTVPPC